MRSTFDQILKYNKTFNEHFKKFENGKKYGNQIIK